MRSAQHDERRVYIERSAQCAARSALPPALAALVRRFRDLAHLSMSAQYGASPVQGPVVLEQRRSAPGRAR